MLSLDYLIKTQSTKFGIDFIGNILFNTLNIQDLDDALSFSDAHATAPAAILIYIYLYS